MNPLICSSVNDQKLLKLFYKGGIRIVESYCYGKGTNGKEVLRAYQIRGYSSKGHPEGWKLFEVDQISSLTLLEETFPGDRRGYNPNDHNLTEFYCRIPQT